MIMISGFVWSTVSPIMIIVKIFDSQNKELAQYYTSKIDTSNKHKLKYDVTILEPWIFLW